MSTLAKYQQGGLFGEPDSEPSRSTRTPAKALARRDGPETSHAAAREVVESGGQERQCAKILELLRLRRATAAELAAIVGEGGNFRARVSDCRKLGHVIDCRKVECAATGKLMNMYFLTRDADASKATS